MQLLLQNSQLTLEAPRAAEKPSPSRRSSFFRLPDGHHLPRVERWTLGAIFGALGILRVFYILHYRVDSDEPQHIHMAWAWSQGLAVYRDVFDNHVPLFHMLMAPLVALFGERADIVIWMRFAMMPIFAATLYGTYLVGRSLFGRRAGLWAAALLGCYPAFFLRSVEFRTDDLWVALWVFTLAILLGGAATPRRFLAAGFLLGVALCVSMKTILMIVSLAVVSLLLPIVSAEFRRALKPRKAMKLIGAFAAGMAVMPLIILSMIWLRDTWDPFIYCTVTHNMIGREKHSSQVDWRGEGISAVGFLAIASWAALVSRRRGAEWGGSRAAALLMILAAYQVLLYRIWPLVQAQTLLSLRPLAALGVVAVPFGLPRRGTDGKNGINFGGLPLSITLVSVAAFYMIQMFIVDSSLTNNAERTTAQITDVLRLTEPGEFVMAPKGEAIFRPRPFYYMLETFTWRRMTAGLIQDEIPQSLADTRTCVLMVEGVKYPPTSREFLDRAYVNVGHVGVAGQLLAPEGSTARAPIPFNVAIATSYDLVTGEGQASGTLDGTPYTGARDLAEGPHVFVPDRGAARLALVWSRAVERGYSPFEATGA